MSGKRKLWQFSTIFFGQTKQNLKNTPNYTFAFSFSFTLMTKMMPEKKNQNQALKTFVVKSCSVQIQQYSRQSLGDQLTNFGYESMAY